MADCFKDTVLVDAPTGFWLPGSYSSLTVPDLSGNGRDLVDTWIPEAVISYVSVSVVEGLLSPYNLGGTPLPPEAGQTVLLLVRAEHDGGANQPRPPYLVVNEPSYYGGVDDGITVPGWSAISTFHFDHDRTIGSDLYQSAYTFALFEHTATAGEDGSVTFRLTVAPHGTTFASVEGMSMILDSQWGIDPTYVRPLVVSEINWAGLEKTSGSWPSYTVPSERYATLNIPVETDDVLNSWNPDSGTVYYSRTGTDPKGVSSGTGADYLRVDWQEAGVDAPARGWSYVTGPAGLVMMTVVLTGMDADFWDVATANPFCTSCAGQPDSSAISHNFRALDFSALTASSGTVTDFYGASVVGYHDFTVEAVARNGDLSHTDTVHMSASGIVQWISDAGTPAISLPYVSENVRGSCWHHVLDVYDHATTTSSLWIDGTVVATSVGSRNPPAVIEVYGYFDAKVAVYAVYDQALPDARITSHFAHLCRMCLDSTEIPSPLHLDLNQHDHDLFGALTQPVHHSVRITNTQNTIQIRPNVSSTKMSPRRGLTGPNPIEWGSEL